MGKVTVTFCNTLFFRNRESFHVLVSIITSSFANINAGDITNAIVCPEPWCFNFVLCNQQKSMHCCTGKSHLSMVHHKACHWQPILHKSLIIRLRLYQREKSCVKNIFSRERTVMSARKLSEAALQ